MLFNVLDRKDTTDTLLLTALIEELNFLEAEGIVVNYKNKTCTLFFKLALVVGDNLGVHSLMGFIEGFTANYPCRFCLINKSEIQSTYKEIDCVLRNKDNYVECFLKNDPSSTGIKNACVFNLSLIHISEPTRPY